MKKFFVFLVLSSLVGCSKSNNNGEGVASGPLSQQESEALTDAVVTRVLGTQSMPESNPSSSGLSTQNTAIGCLTVVADSTDEDADSVGKLLSVTFNNCPVEHDLVFGTFRVGDLDDTRPYNGAFFETLQAVGRIGETEDQRKFFEVAARAKRNEIHCIENCGANIEPTKLKITHAEEGILAQNKIGHTLAIGQAYGELTGEKFAAGGGKITAVSYIKGSYNDKSFYAGCAIEATEDANKCSKGFIACDIDGTKVVQAFEKCEPAPAP